MKIITILISYIVFFLLVHINYYYSKCYCLIFAYPGVLWPHFFGGWSGAISDLFSENIVVKLISNKTANAILSKFMNLPNQQNLSILSADLQVDNI